MFEQKDNYTYRMDELGLKYSDKFVEKNYCLIQRINTGIKPDEWDQTHDCIRGEMVLRVLNVQPPERDRVTLPYTRTDLGGSLRLEDSQGNVYEALRITKHGRDIGSVLRDSILSLGAGHIRISLSDQLRNRLENDSYYPYAGSLRNTANNSVCEIIQLSPLDNLQAMEAMERMKKYREESENRRKQDEEREAAKRRYQEEARLAELKQQKDYAARNAAVDQSELDRMFRSSGR